MICPRCGSAWVDLTVVTENREKNRGCCGWFLWGLLAAVTFGLILIIPAVTNTKRSSKTYTEALCRSCGLRWRVR